MNCTNKNFTNFNSPNYQDWLVNTSYSYAEYISRNNQVLPPFSKDSEFYVKYEIDNLVKSMLPQSFEVKDLTDLTADLPFETKAAYFKKVLYFGSNANKNDALEEIFHASLQSMISSNKREQLLLEGKKLIDDYKGYVKQQIESSPEIYSKFNTQKEKEDRAIEEFIAKKFVNFYNQSEDTNNSFIDRIFKWLRDLFNNIFYNKIELESFFNLIKDGYYKDKSIISEGSNVPATALLEHYSVVEGEVQITDLNANDSLTIIKQLSNLVYEAKRLNTFTNFKDDTKKRTGITKDEINTILDRGIVALYEYYSETNDKKADALNFDINNFSEDTQEYVDENDLINLKAKLKEEVYKYIQEYLEKDVDFDELEDEEEVMLSADTIGADERGFDSISQYLKEYISTVGIPTGKFIKYKNNRTIEIKELTDPNTIYYALARGLKNTDDDYERFVKFKKLAYLPQNRFVKALYEKFVLDITENQNLNKTDTKKVLDTFNAKVDRLDNTVDLKEELGITDTGLILFTDLIKGFDFWVKPSMIITAELTEENNTTKITKVKAFNPNQNSAEKSLLNISKEYYFRNESFFYNESLKEELKKKLSNVNTLISPNVAYTNDDFKNLIYDLHEVLSKTFLEDFTPAQSLLLVREILKNEVKDLTNPSTITTLEYENVLDYSEVSIFYIRNIISGLLKDINKDIDEATLFDFEKAKLSNDLNSLFKAHSSITEKVQESTYKNADGKNIYLYQWRNASLVFLNKHFKNTKSFESLLNNISNKLQFPLLKTQEKDDNYEYMKDHYFIDKYMKDGKLSNSFKLGEFYAIEGIKDGTYNNETTFAGMSNNDFLLYRLLLSNTKEKEGLQPVFLNLMEAKKTALFVEVPKIDFSDLQEYYKLFAKEIQREKSRIERETLKIENLLKKQEQPEGTYTLKLSNQIAKNIDTEFLYYEKYHPTEVTYTVNADGSISIEKINGRAFTFSTALKGILSEKELQEFTNSELDVQRIGKNFNNYFQDLIKHLKENDLVDLTQSFFNKEGQISESRKRSLLSEFLNTIYLNQLLSGDPATIVKNDVVDFNKRMASLNATIQTVYNNFTNPSLGIDKPVTELKIVTGTEPSLKSSFSNDKIDVADAQTYTTVKGMRRYLYGLNKLTKPLAEILDTIDAGGRLSKQQVDYMFENNIFLNVVKPVGYDGKHYIKTGMFMLTKDFTSHNGRAIPGMEFLHNLRENMEQHEIDMFMPQSASKMMVTNIFETENFSTSNFEDFGSYSYTMSAKDFGQQLENPSGKQLIIDPSQQLEILMNEQEGTIKVYQAGKIKTILDIQKLYSSLLANRDELMFNQAFNEISDESFQLKYKDFLDKVKASLVDTGADPQTIDFFTPTETGKKYNLNMAITKDKFAQLFFAHFTKGILKQKVSGDALALVSSANVKVLKRVVKKTDSKGNEIYTWEVIKKNSDEYNSVRDYTVIESNVQYDENDNFNQLINNGIDSELITKLKELGEGAYFYDELRSFKPKWVETPKGLSVQGYFAEAMLPRWKKDLQISEQTKWLWSTRIPAQDKHSGLNIEWVDELPIYYGNTIITAKEIVLLSGADFDIDKLFLVKPELYFNKDKGEYVQYDNKDSEEQYVTYQYNYNKSVKKKVKEKLEENEIFQNLLNYRNELYSELENYNTNESFETNERVSYLRNLIKEAEYNYEETHNMTYQDLNNFIEGVRNEIIDVYQEVKEDVSNLKDKHLVKLSKINSSINKFKTEKIKEVLQELNIPFNNENVAVLNNEFLQLRQLLNTNEHNVNSLKTKLTYPKLESKITASTDDTEIERLNLIKNLLDEYYHVNSDKIAISKTAVSQDYLMGKGDDTLEDSTYYEIDKEGIPLLNEDNQLIIKNVFAQGEFKKEFPYSYHSFLGQIFNHKNTQTGRSNIGIAVNYNLLGIALNRLGVSLNEPILIDDLELKDFGLLTYDNRRIFDIASMIVSAATDEAKDQQNAKYGLTVEALNIAIPLLLLKTPPKIIILILHQPVIKQYLKLVSKKEQIFLSKTDLENKFVGNDTLLKTLVNHNLSPRVLTIKDLIEGKSKNELNNNIQANVVNLVSTIINTNKEIKPLNSYIKLKKGLGSTLQEFDKLYEDSNTLQTIPTAYTNLYEKLNTDRVNEDSLQKQYFNYEKLVIPKINTLLNKHFLDYQDFVKQLKGKIDFHTRFFKSEKDKAEFNKKFLSFFYTYIWKDSFADKMEIFQNPLNSKKFIEEYKELKFQFPQNLFLQRVRVFNNELVFQTYVKLPKPLQLSINDSFRELHFIILTNPKFKKYQDFIKSLYLYHARKDGWLFRNNSLAKALPAEQFLKHSESLDNWLDLDNTPNDMLLEQLTYHFMQNFKNEGLSINKLLKPDLRNTTSDNFGFANDRYFIDINKVEDEDKFLIELIKSKQDYVYTAKKFMLGDKVVANKTLKPAYALNINKGLYELSKVYYRLNRFVSEEYILTQIDKLPLVINQEQSIITRVEYKKVDSKLNTNENELTNDYNLNTNLQYEDVKELGEVVYDRGANPFVTEVKSFGVNKDNPELPYVLKYTSKNKLEVGSEIPIFVFEDGKLQKTDRMGTITKASDTKAKDGYFYYEVEENKNIPQETQNSFVVNNNNNTELIYNQLGNKTQSENVVIDEVNGRKPAVENIREPKINDIVTIEFYFEKEDKTISVKAKIIELEKIYQGGSVTKDNQGNIIKEEKGIPEYFVTLEKLNGSGKYEFAVGVDGYITQTLGKNSKTFIGSDNYIDAFNITKENIYTPIVAYRTKNNNFLEALEKDNAIGNPWSHAGYSLYKTNTVKEAVEEFIAWVTGEKHIDKLQDYRQAIIDKIPELKGKPILYYKELGEPSHATALDWIVNKYDWDNEIQNNLDISTLLTNGLVDTEGLTKINVKDAEVFTKQIFNKEESEKVFKFIEKLYNDTYEKEHQSNDKFGKGRRSMYFSDESYTYSGTTRPANLGNENLQRLITKITKELGFQEGYFDMILINEYKDGTQKIGFHTDNEPILNNKGKLNPSVVTISFGDERTMILKGNNKEYKIPMKSGMGLIMGKDGQINYKHGIDSENNKTKRYSITLRHNAVKNNSSNKTLQIQEQPINKEIKPNELLVIEENEIPKKEGESFGEMQQRVTQNVNIRKRIEIAQKNNITQGNSYSFSEIKRLFNNEKLFDNEIYKQLDNILQSSNLVFKFGSLNKGKKSINAYYDSINNSINIDTLVLQTPNLATSDFKRILLHEIIHAATFINLKEGVSLTNIQKIALNNLNNLIEELKKDKDFFAQYGLTNANELLAELANEQFVDKLKKKTFDNNQSFFDKIISEIVKLLGLKTTAYAIVKESFDNLINEKLQIVNQSTEIKPKIDSSKKINIDKKSILLNNALNIAIKEYLPDLDYFYLELPVGLSEKEQEYISFLLFEDGKSKESKEVEKKYIRRILNKEDLEKAKITEKNYAWSVYNEDGDSSIKSLLSEIERIATTLIDNNIELEGLGFERLLNDFINGKINDDFKEIAENKLKEYGLYSLINYNPNQLSLFEDTIELNQKQTLLNNNNNKETDSETKCGNIEPI